MIEGIEHLRAVVWDFDGVLNRQARPGADGLLDWQRELAADTGLDPRDLMRRLAAERAALLTGKADILDVIEGWAGRLVDAEDVLELILEATHDPDPELLRLIDALAEAGVVQVLALDTDSRRARWLAQDRDWAVRVDAIVASNETGLILPDPAALAGIQASLGLAPAEILLIDDTVAHVAAAEKRGWLGWDYPPGGARALVAALMPLLLRGAE